MSDVKHQTILMFGCPGSGKGTQGKMLDACPGFFHHSSGDVFRSLDRDSALGRTVADYAARGELVPDDITIEVWKRNIDAHAVLSHYLPGRDLLILDGIPRNANQARIMREHLDVLGVIHLVCENEDVIVERLRKRALKEKRPDDAKEDVIRRRFEIYHEETRPVLEQYDASQVKEVEPEGTPVEVLHRILGHIGPIQKQRLGNALA